MANSIEETDVAVVGAGGGGLRYQVLSTTAGWRTLPPFSLIDPVIAAGLLPDIRANEKSPHPMSS